MTYSPIFNQKITILRAGQKHSPYSSDPVEDWTNPTRVSVDYLVSIQPRASTEGPIEHPQIVDTWWLCTPPGRDLDLRSSDRIELTTGLKLTVEGNPLKWPDPYHPEKVHHVEANLEAVHG